MKTVLYINGKLGIWVGFDRNTCVNVHVESLSIGNKVYQPCAWLNSDHQPVDLVVDGEQTEIIAYPLQPAGTSVHQLTHSSALRKTLVDRNREAIIQTPSKSTGLDALLVQRLNLSESDRCWLRHVEKSAITFCSVTTSAEIVANFFSQSEQPYLVISHMVGHSKHTFCRCGHALFTRTIEHSEKLTIADGLQETLSHLYSTELIKAPVTVHSIGFSDRQLTAIAKLEWVDELVKSDGTTPCQFSRDTNLDVNKARTNAVIFIAQQALKQAADNSFGNKRRVTTLLSKHWQWLRHRRRRRQFIAISALAFCSAGYSGSKQLQHQQRFSDYRQTKKALSLAIEEAQQAVYGESPVGLALSDALQNAQALNTNVGPAPAHLLTTIATVFTEHRGLLLQEMDWAVIDHADSSSTGFFDGDSERISSRNRRSLTHESVSKLVVNIIGNSHSGATLRDQHRALDALIATLRSYRFVSQIKVLEAPLSMGAGAERIGTDALERSSGFSIRFHFDHSYSNGE